MLLRGAGDPVAECVCPPSLTSLQPKFVGIATGAILLALAVVAGAQAPMVAGPNINMVGGPASVTVGPPFQILGDPYLQRQNEPSIACSSRNPLNCLASANDYRLVTAPGLPDGKVTGDAWLGVFWTHDGGASWRSTALPGFPQDTSADGTASPLKGFSAASDPTVRPGTNGLFYLSGIVFNSANQTSTNNQPGGGGEPGELFVSLFVDDNNAQTADTPIRYVRSVIADNGTSGQFLDKPWIAVDIPRKGAGSCTIPGKNGIPDQTVPAGKVYLAYSVFLGSGNNPHSKILFTSSSDCGQTWANPTKLDESYSTDQSAQIAVNPVTGDVLVTWRNFGTSNLSDPNQILVAKSTDGGNTFTKGIQVTNLGLVNSTTAFDQPTAPVPNDPELGSIRMFRTNDYPSACVDATGRYWLAWSQQQPFGLADGTTEWLSQVMVATSTDGVTWPASGQPVEPFGGHQIVPSIACTGSAATVMWYDQRGDLAPLSLLANYGWLMFDLIPPVTPHTLDVRAIRGTATTTSTGTTLSFPQPSISVSRYQYALVNTGTASAPQWALQQLEFNPVDWPLFAGGTIPFLGDYVDLVPVKVFNSPVGKTGWTFNTTASDGGMLQAAWTDNRDIPKQPTDNWSYTPAGTSSCNPQSPGTFIPSMFTRNQNVYTSRVGPGLIVGVQGNSRLVGPSTRAFAVSVQNGTPTQRRVLLTFGASPFGTASFRSDATLVQLAADVGAQSAIARTVFVASTQTAPVLVQATEIDTSGNVVPNGLTGAAIINPDPTAPPPLDSSLSTLELHTPSMSDAIVNTYLNPTFLNPTFLNPTFLNPTFLNPTFLNPTFLNPTFLNPTFLNPTFLNPTFLNTSPTLNTYTTDVSWQVSNTGNVATGYNFAAILSSLSTGTAYQLIINKIYTTPGANNCVQGSQYNAQILNVIGNPVLTASATGGNPLAPDVTNATFALAAGEMAVVTLRVEQSTNTPFDVTQVAAVTASQPANSDGSSSKAVYDKQPPVIAPHPDVTASAVNASGATVVYTAPATTDNVDGTGVATCMPASGSLFPLGTTTVTCTATDAAGNVAVPTTFHVIVSDTTPPVIGTVSNITVPATSPSGAVVNYTLPTVTDNISTGLVASCTPAPGSTFPVGTTTVTCTAVDGAGNQATPVTFTVTVTATATATANPNTLLWSPNKTLTPVVVSGVIDDVLPIVAPATTPMGSYYVIDEYGTCQPSGSFSVNATTGAYSFTVSLEAWRQGTDANGRLYTIYVQAVDTRGQTVTTTTTVVVPHNQ